MDRLYYRGFLLSKEPIRAPESFLERRFSGFYFYHHPALEVIERDRYLFCGHAVNVVSGEFSTDAGELDDLSGRFVVIYSDGRVLHDACGLNPVFYSERVVGSHASLVAEQIGSGDSDVLTYSLDRDQKYRYGWPGAHTPYAGVKMLTPNTLLEFPNKVRRYFPAEDLPSLSVEESAEVVLAAMRRQLDALRERSLLVSLTAGVDSRISLAAARGYPVRFFTYVGQPVHRVDAAVAGEIARRLGLAHEVVRITATPEELEAGNALNDRHTYCSHSRMLACVYAREFSGCLHLRSNLAEIGRAFYKVHGKSGGISKSADLSSCVYGYRFDKAEPVQQAFREFWEETGFDRLHNYDPYDMLYWEHRMGCWHSHVVLESDLAFDTHVLFNARRILKAMLAVPLQDRIEANVFHEIIRRELPELSDIPINPESWPA